VTAFELAQPRPVSVAHHRHASAQVVEGARRGLPVVVLAREPEDAVVSLVLFDRGRTAMRQALLDYVRFYEDVLPVLDRAVVATFPQVTSDLGAVIGAVNARFGTDFSVFEHTAENVERCFALIDEAQLGRLGHADEGRVARPSERRVETAAVLHADYRAEPDELRGRADRLYARLSVAAER
jgi:hypothetical protein